MKLLFRAGEFIRMANTTPKRPKRKVKKVNKESSQNCQMNSLTKSEQRKREKIQEQNRK